MTNLKINFLTLLFDITSLYLKITLFLGNSTHVANCRIVLSQSTVHQSILCSVQVMGLGTRIVAHGEGYVVLSGWSSTELYW